MDVRFTQASSLIFLTINRKYSIFNEPVLNSLNIFHVIFKKMCVLITLKNCYINGISR